MNISTVAAPFDKVYTTRMLAVISFIIVNQYGRMPTITDVVVVVVLPQITG